MGIEIPQDNPTPASEWPSARKHGFVVTLPSGAKARIRRTLNLPELLTSGKIPNPLANILSEVIGNAASNLEEGKPSTTEPPFKFSDVANVETIQGMLEMVDAVCIQCFLEPRVVAAPEGIADDSWEPPEGCITLTDLTLDDKMFVWQYAMGGPADLASFRAATSQAVSAALDGDVVPQQAEQPARSG